MLLRVLHTSRHRIKSQALKIQAKVCFGSSNLPALSQSCVPYPIRSLFLATNPVSGEFVEYPKHSGAHRNFAQTGIRFSLKWTNWPGAVAPVVSEKCLAPSQHSSPVPVLGSALHGQKLRRHRRCEHSLVSRCHRPKLQSAIPAPRAPQNERPRRAACSSLVLLRNDSRCEDKLNLDAAQHETLADISR